MARSTFRLTGFKELERALAEELPKATARGALLRTAKKVMKPIETGMAERAPFDENDRDDDGNHLNETMKTQTVTAKRARGSVQFDRSTGVAVMTGPAPVGKRARANAGWQENGTAKMPANPYARPTADAEGENVIHSVRDELAAEIDKTKTRIARRAAKRGL